MPKKALASLNVVINAVTTPLFRGLNRASKRLAVFGAKMRAVGRSMTMSFTLPFLAIGVAGAKMAIDFEKNMTKIKTLVGISAKEVNNLSGQVMKLSGKTAQAPAELADGLYFLTSAGLRGSNAMETLSQVAKGVAIGLGDQADLAKVAAAAQNAYGEETISASKALDVFGGAVREGMFEASDLAEVLGTQLGMASSLGISFEETNAFIATYTRTTGDAKAASTSFGGVMMALAKTTPKMEKALKEVGMSGDFVRQMLGEQGLQATLIHIKDAFEANNVPLTDFFSKSQALKGVLGVLGNQTENYDRILKGLSDTTGLVDDGFNTLEDTTGFKMQKSFNELKLAVQELGVTMMPIFTKIVNGAVKIANGFTSLDSGTKMLATAAATLVAFSGPLLTMAGGVMKALSMMTGPIGIVVVALGVMFALIYENWAEVRPIFVDWINYWITLYNESEVFRRLVQSIGAAFKSIWAFIKFFFTACFQQIRNLTKYGGDFFEGLGKRIKGAFTFDVKMGYEGKKMMEDFGKGMREGMDKIEGDFSDEWSDINTTMAKNMRAKPLLLVTEEDIDKGLTDMETYLTDKVKALQDKLKDLLGSGSYFELPEELTEGGPGEADGPIPDPDPTTTSKWQDFFTFMKDNFSGLSEKALETFETIMGAASSVINGIGNLWAAEHEKEKTILDNEETASQEQFDKDYERELAEVENSKMNEEDKNQAILDLKENFETRQEGMDETFDSKKKALQTKAAKREKSMKIMQSVMGTAQAVVNALGSVPFPYNLAVAAMVGGLGAAQIAAIASTPLPMATGGLAFGPVNAIVGDNPNAANDPEVVAPLSKLKNMLGNEMNVELNVGGIVKGNDIYLSNDLTTEQRPRYI
tara:strand:+ start:2077 stop:4686 length:2610 start_codon:yes stop_codon:yes gene_type:complete